MPNLCWKIQILAKFTNLCRTDESNTYFGDADTDSFIREIESRIFAKRAGSSNMTGQWNFAFNLIRNAGGIRSALLASASASAWGADIICCVSLFPMRLVTNFIISMTWTTLRYVWKWAADWFPRETDENCISLVNRRRNEGERRCMRGAQSAVAQWWYQARS